MRAFLASYWTPAGRQALRNLIGLAVCTGVSQACALGVLLVLTHGLSQAAFGAVIFALNVQTYLITLGTFGLTTIVVRDLTQQPEKADETTTAYLTIVVVASSLTGLATAVVAAVLPISWDERVMLWCVAAGNVFACLNLNALYDAAHRQALAAALMVPGDLLLIGVVGGCWAAGGLTVFAVGVAVILRFAATATLQAAAVRGRVYSARLSWHRGRAWKMIRAGQPMLWSALLYSVPMSGGVVLMRVFQSEERTAVYGLAFQLVAAELLLVSLAMRVLYPHITGPYGLRARFVCQLALALTFGMGVLCGAAIGAGWVLVAKLLPSSYASVYPVFAILQLFVLGYALAAVVNYYLLRLHWELWVTFEHAMAVVAYLGIIVSGGHRFEFGFPIATAVSAGVLVAIGVLGCRMALSRVLPNHGKAAA